MIAFAFVLCLIIYAICFWLAFGELERPQGAISSQSGSSDVGVDKAVPRRDGRASKVSSTTYATQKMHDPQNRIVQGGTKG